MGNCQSRLCFTADETEDTAPKRSGSEKSSNSEKNSCSADSVRGSPQSVSDRLKKLLCCRRKSKSKKTDEEKRREFILQLCRSVREETNEKIRKAREITLALRANGVNQGASTSAELPPSCQFLINHPRLFEYSLTEDEDDDDDVNIGEIKTSYKREQPEETPDELDSASQELDPEIAACMPQGSSLSSPISSFHVSPVRYLSYGGDDDDHRTSSSGYSWLSTELSEPPSPRPRARTRVIRRRNNSIEGFLSSSGSEREEDALPRVQTPSPSPEFLAHRRRGFLRTVFERIAHRNRSNRVHDVTSRGYAQSTNNSAIRGYPQSSNRSPVRETSQASNNRSPLMRTWLSILGRSSPPSTGTKKGCKLLPTVTAEQVLASTSSVEQGTEAEVSASPSPAQSSTSSTDTSFECEDDMEICSFASNSNTDARLADFGGT